MSSAAGAPAAMSAHDQYMAHSRTGRYFRTLKTVDHNPNRKLRLRAPNPAIRCWHRGASTEPSPFLRLGSLKFAKGDRSVYLVPQPIGPVTTVARRKGTDIGEAVVPPDQGSHISFHESGVVNVHGIGSESLRVRDAGAVDSTAPLFTCGFRSFERYGPESRANDDGVIVAASGPADWPTFISVFVLGSGVELDDDKPFAILSHSPLEMVITVAPFGTRYVFACWTSPPDTFRGASRRNEVDFIVLPGLPPGVSIRRPG